MDVLELNKDMIEIFDMNCDYYEPINKNFDDNIFISNSFLPQSHFEDDYKDIIDEFQKITDAKLLFDKIKK
jgi:RAB protein geranylgeranyltransferase component A